MVKSQTFFGLNEAQKAEFLIKLSSEAIGFIKNVDIQLQIKKYIDYSERILKSGEKIYGKLIVFLDDPNMEKDFNKYFEMLRGDEKALAALDLISYTCAYVCRITAQSQGYSILPDPVLLAVDEEYSYYESKAKLLKLL